MKRMIIHNGFFRLLIPPMFGILTYVIILLLNNNLSQLGEIFSEQEVYVTIVLAYIWSESQRLWIVGKSKFDFGLGNNLEHVVMVVGSVLVSILITTFYLKAYFNLILNFTISETQLLVFNSIFGFGALLNQLLYFSYIFLNKENTDKIERERLQTQSVQLQMDRFKNEINPTLLYESLENIITLIYSNPDAAEDYIDKMSAFYRYILSERKAELSSFDTEYKAVEYILFLLNAQYNNCINVTNTIQDNELLLVPGTLAYLIERIVRQTIISPQTPLDITVSSDSDYIIIEHKLKDRLIKDEHTDGLFKSIQNSYAYYATLPVVQVKAFEVNYIKLPKLVMREEVA